MSQLSPFAFADTQSRKWAEIIRKRKKKKKRKTSGVLSLEIVGMWKMEEDKGEVSLSVLYFIRSRGKI